MTKLLPSEQAKKYIQTLKLNFFDCYCAKQIQSFFLQKMLNNILLLLLLHAKIINNNCIIQMNAAIFMKSWAYAFKTLYPKSPSFLALMGCVVFVVV